MKYCLAHFILKKELPDYEGHYYCRGHITMGIMQTMFASGLIITRLKLILARSRISVVCRIAYDYYMNKVHVLSLNAIAIPM
jgi:hypothetical protein